MNKSSHQKKGNDIKLSKFSKLEALRTRWGDKDLKQSKLKEYNKWSVNEKFKIIEIELRLEHYLCQNILVDLNDKDDLFELDKRETYFPSKNLRNGKISKIVKFLEKDNKKLSITRIKNLSLGKKIILWSSLKKGIFQNKFMGLNSKQEQKRIFTALENIRNIRNGIAHLESKEQIYSKLRMFDSREKADKLKIYKQSINLCRKMQSR